jgi:hypothetical protein
VITLKEVYEKPICRVDEFKTQDVISTSNPLIDEEGWINKWY